eukprot:s45_g39.t1
MWDGSKFNIQGQAFRHILAILGRKPCWLLGSPIRFCPVPMSRVASEFCTESAFQAVLGEVLASFVMPMRSMYGSLYEFVLDAHCILLLVDQLQNLSFAIRKSGILDFGQIWERKDIVHQMLLPNTQFQACQLNRSLRDSQWVVQMGEFDVRSLVIYDEDPNREVLGINEFHVAKALLEGQQEPDHMSCMFERRFHEEKPGVIAKMEEI